MKEPLWGQRPVTDVKRTFHKSIPSTPVSHTISSGKADSKTTTSDHTSSSSSSVKSSIIASNLEVEVAIDKNGNEYKNDLKILHDNASDSNLNISNTSNSFKDSTLMPSQTL
jgi:hypothetical protein